MCLSQPSRVKPQRPLKKLPAKFKIKHRRPWKKSQARCKIKRPPYLNQSSSRISCGKPTIGGIQKILQPSSRSKLWKVNKRNKIRADSSTTKAKDHLPHEAPCGPISTFKIQPRRPLKKSQAQFKIKPQRPLKKSSAQFKIKP
ncbi:hypothetical protein ACFX13_041428 [Malus domestica]